MILSDIKFLYIYILINNKSSERVEAK
jgi:hypothetical protein